MRGKIWQVGWGQDQSAMATRFSANLSMDGTPTVHTRWGSPLLGAACDTATNKVNAVGMFKSFQGGLEPTESTLFARVNFNGLFDTSLGGDGLAESFLGDVWYDVLVETNGKVVGVGRSGPSLSVVRLNSNGSNDSTFRQGAPFRFGIGQAVARETSGEYLVVSNFTTPDDRRPFVFRYLTNGSFDMSWASLGWRSLDWNGEIFQQASDIAVDPSGRVYVLGTTFNE